MKPILFNSDMVRAIMGMGKKVTRRVVKGADPEWGFVGLSDNMEITAVDAEGLERPESVDGLFATFDGWNGYTDYPVFKSPYRPGDVLYVRETWERFYCCNCEGDMAGECFNGPPDSREGCNVYRASHTINGDARWHPSIHMPKEAARLFLRVTDVRVERLQDITDGQAIKEGARSTSGFVTDPENEYAPPPHSAVEDFQRIWDSTIQSKSRDLYGWAANPWVWVIEFKRISKEEAMKSEDQDHEAASGR